MKTHQKGDVKVVAAVDTGKKNQGEYWFLVSSPQYQAHRFSKGTNKEGRLWMINTRTILIETVTSVAVSIFPK